MRQESFRLVIGTADNTALTDELAEKLRDILDLLVINHAVMSVQKTDYSICFDYCGPVKDDFDINVIENRWAMVAPWLVMYAIYATKSFPVYHEIYFGLRFPEEKKAAICDQFFTEQEIQLNIQRQMYRQTEAN